MYDEGVEYHVVTSTILNDGMHTILRCVNRYSVSVNQQQRNQFLQAK